MNKINMIVMILLMVVSVSALSRQIPYYEKPMSAEEKELRKAEAHLDTIRQGTVKKFLDGDPIVDGDYDKYKKARQKLLDKKGLEETLLEQTKLLQKKVELESAGGKVGVKGIPVSRDHSGSRSGEQPEPSLASQYSDFFHDYFFRDYYGYGPKKEPAPESIPSYYHPDDDMADYVVEMPAVITGGQPKNVKVRVNSGKMKMLKTKQDLNKMLIDDVLRMTGKLP